MNRKIMVILGLFAAVPVGASVALIGVNYATSAMAEAPLPPSVPPSVPPAVVDPVTKLLARAQVAAPNAVAFAMQKGAKVASGKDTFNVEWLAGATDTLVSLHGHSGWAYEDVEHWQPWAAQRKFNLIAPQWWVGTADNMDDYLNPRSLYRDIDESLKAIGATPGRVMLHGFSRGATQTYSLAAMDAQNAHWFGTVIANAGGAHTDYPPTGEVERGAYGDRPYAGQKWILFCGGKDKDPQINGCPAMKETRRWLEKRGGAVTLIEDPKADHGGFQRNARNVERALDLWLK